MDTRDAEAIESLFAKLGDVEVAAGPRDVGAERLIAERIAHQPGAPYYMAQTIVMQDAALANQQQRIEQLEREAAERATAEVPAEHGFLPRSFGGASATSGRGSVPSVGGNRPSAAWGERAAAEAPRNPEPASAPAQGTGFGRGMGGGGFLAGAAQTAMGVAGGVLLGNALAGMFGGHEAKSVDQTAAANNDAATGGGDAGQGAAGDSGTQEASYAPAQDDASRYDTASQDAASDDSWFGGDDGGGFDEI